MATKDHENFYAGLDVAPPPNAVPNTVSRSLKVGDRAFQTIVTQSGKAILDSELQLVQDADQFAKSIINRFQAPSGWLRGQTRYDGYNDYVTETSPAINDDGTGTHIDPNPGPGVLVNAFVLPRLVAQVAGMPIVVEYTNTRDPDYNLIYLEEPTIYDGGSPDTFKRTDFVFLEVWKALVAPSVASQGSLTVVTNGDIDPVGPPPDEILLNAIPLVAVVGAPGLDEFEIGVDESTTATNIAAAINDPVNSFATFIKAKAFGQVVQLYAVVPGVAGDAITLAVTLINAGCITVSGPNLTGGEDRPNKPNQNQLWRHGNVLSPSQVWLDDELVDPVVNRETTQRVQIQYRIRSTGPAEAVNYKTNPDGFSTMTGGPPVQTILAWGGIGGDVTDYPFVRADRTSVTLNSSAVEYDVEDPGLWVAGDGTQTAAQDLNSVDGFVYAIPICFVHRHNDASNSVDLGFNPTDNTNGAPLHDHVGYVSLAFGQPIPAGDSDRPDGSFADVINQNNLLDLRRHIIFPGIDTSAELQYQIQSLLDGSLRTWSVDAADKQELGNGSGDVSTRFLVCNEIGRTVAHGGSPGEGTTRGDFIREFDHIARRFGDQAVTERFVMAFYPGDRNGVAVPPGLNNAGKYVTKGANGTLITWGEDDVLTLDLANLDATTLGTLFQGLSGDGTSAGAAIFVADLIPAGTVITDILTIRHDDGNSVGAIDQNVQVKSILGLGTTAIDITLDANNLPANGGDGPPDYHLVDPAAVAASPRRIFVEFELTYPIGVGTTDTVYLPLTPNAVVYDPVVIPGVGPGPMVAEDVAQAPADMELIDGQLPPKFREGYREIQLEYVANGTIAHAAPLPTTPISDSIVSQDANTLYFPRRVYDSRSISVFDTLAAAPVVVDNGNTEWGSSSRLVKTTGVISASGQVLCNIEYYAQDAIPNYGNDGYQVGVYFRTHAPQTAGVSDLPPGTGEGGVLPTTLRVEPLYVAPDVWTNQVGSGSQDRGFPYLAPMDQVPINDGTVPATLTNEWYLCATADVTVDDFNADTGIIALRPFVQADGQNVATFGDPAATKKPRKDQDFRAFYPWADDTLYRPTVLSQPMFGAVRHKVLFPFLACATETIVGVDGGVLYRKNEVLLIVVSRFAELDAENNVRFTDPVADNRTCAALYRTRNLLLLVGDRVTFP